MGDARGRSSMGGGGNAVVDDLYRDKAVNSGTVGEVTTNIRIVCREGLKRGARTRGYWWRHEVTEKKLQDTLTGVSLDDRRRRLQGDRVVQ